MSWSARTADDTKEFFDSAEEIRRKMRKTAQLLKAATHAMVFTGAGLSTAAGIADFRSGLTTALPTGPGLWAAQADYERRTGGERSERTKNDPTRPRVDLDRMLSVEPTLSHRVISALVREGYVKSVLTQNVDNLHRRSGVPRSRLCELHGNLQCERCDACGAEFQRDFRVGPNPGPAKHYGGRACEACKRGRLRDYLVPFGEDLPRSETDFAWDEAGKADFCLVLGSSLTVTPACDYAGWVGRRGREGYERGDLCIVNIQKTPYDGCGSVVCHTYCDEAMRVLAEELGVQLGDCEPKDIAQPF